MRVLWLCNFMLPVVAEHLGKEATNKEGWLSGLAAQVLERAGENDITLAAAFPVGEDLLENKEDIFEKTISAYEGTLCCYGFYENTDRPEQYDEALETRLKKITDRFQPDVVHCFGTEYPHTLAMCRSFPRKDRLLVGIQGLVRTRLKKITDRFQPDVVHCFGTEYPHTLAMCRSFPRKDRLLVGIQGLVSVYANAYFASLPKETVHSVTLRDFLKKDSLVRQQQKFEYFASLPKETVHSVTLRDFLKKDSLVRQQQKFEKRGRMETEAVRLAGNVTGRTEWDRFYTEKWNPKAVYHMMNETLRPAFYTDIWQEERCVPHSIFLSQGDYPIKGLHYVLEAPKAVYHMMNETLRPAFYTDIWQEERCVPHSIFLSQGDYPIKGLHYVLEALPAILEKYPDATVSVAGNSLVRYETFKDKLKISAYGVYLRKMIADRHLEGKITRYPWRGTVWCGMRRLRIS